MPTTKYTEAERQRHPDAYSIRLDPDQAFGLCLLLCEAWRMPPLGVRFHQARAGKKNWTWYRDERPRPRVGNRRAHIEPDFIDFDEDTLSVAVVAHEFAHFVHRHEFNARRRVATSQKRAPRAERWHGPEHTALVEEVLTLLESMFPNLLLNKKSTPSA